MVRTEYRVRTLVLVQVAVRSGWEKSCETNGSAPLGVGKTQPTRCWSQFDIWGMLSLPSLGGRIRKVMQPHVIWVIVGIDYSNTCGLASAVRVRGLKLSCRMHMCTSSAL